MTTRDEAFFNKLFADLNHWQFIPDNFLVAEFCHEKKYDMDELLSLTQVNDRWKKEFMNACRREETTIVQRALEGKFNPAFARFYLINKHHYRAETGEGGTADKELTVVVRGLEPSKVKKALKATK